MKKLITIILLSVATVALWSGCQQQQETTPETPTAPETTNAPTAP